MDTKTSSTDWTDEEIQAAVDAYLDMLRREQAGVPINKAYENRVLREGVLSARTKGSIEFRMQNISTVMVQLNRDPIRGYKPAQNVGANVIQSIKRALDAGSLSDPIDHEPTADETTLELRAKNLEQQTLQTPPEGIARPKQAVSSGTSFVRDPEVRAWVRKQAKGICEGCDQPAPFEVEGRPFLEVHHIKHLAQQGSDRISNAVALCPNCHRRCHHSSDKVEFTLGLYAKVKRLVRED